MRLSLDGDRSTDFLGLALITRMVVHGVRVVKGYFPASFTSTDEKRCPRTAAGRISLSGRACAGARRVETDDQLDRDGALRPVAPARVRALPLLRRNDRGDVRCRWLR